MRSVEWNKKEELVAEQAMKYLKVRCHRPFVLIDRAVLTGILSPVPAIL